MRLSIPLFSCLLGLVMLLLPQSASTQTPLKGMIIDATDRSPLQSATIQIEGTYRGTITNSSGEFELLIPQFPATLQIRFIGYNSRSITIDAISDNFIIELTPVPVSMREVVVTGEDPAIEIMREVIRRKQIWRDMLDTFEAEAYSRQRLENDTGIVTITETLSRVYWDKRRGIREVIKSRTQTSNIDPTQNFASATNLPNFYDDDISISGFSLVGVTHPNALSYYHFKLEGFRQLDDKTVFDISVSPRRRLQPTFEGKIAVLDEDFALIEVDLRPGESVMFPPPIQEFGLAYKQQFSNFGRDFWLPVDVRIEGTIKFGFPGLQFPAIKFAQLSRLTNYEVNGPMPDSLFAISRRVLVDTLSVNYGGSDARIELMRVPLDDMEASAYQTLDSTQTLDRAFRPTGALARFIDDDDDRESRPSGPLARFLGKKFTGVSPVLGYNRVDAGRLGLNYDIPLKGKFRPSLGAIYTTGTRSWDYTSKLAYRHRGSYVWGLTATYDHLTRHRFSESMFDPYIISGNTILAAPDYFNYFKSTGASLEGSFSKRRSDWTFSTKTGFEKISSMEKSTNYSIPGGFIQRDNPMVDEGTDVYTEVRISYGSDDVPFSVIGNKYGVIAIRQGLGGAHGDFDYTRISARLDWQFPTFYKRRFLANTLDVRLVAGTYLNDLPYHLWHGFDSSLGYFGPFGTFKTLGNLPVEAESVAAIHWEHNFRTIPFEFVGLMGLARKGYGVIVHGSHGIYRSDAARSVFTMLPGHSLSGSTGELHEMGMSINGVFGLLRIDASKRLNGNGYFVGFSIARIL